MTPFKCWGCDDYNDGEGSKRCIGCFEDQMPAELSIWNVKPEFYEPDVIASIGQEFTTSTLKMLKCLDEREATIMLQSALLDMTQEEIAKFHGLKQYKVHRIISKSVCKIKKYR